MAIIMTTIFSIENNNVDISKLFTGPWKFLVLFLSLIIISLAVTIISPKRFFLKHLIWIIFICLISALIYPMYKENRQVFYHSGVTTIILVLILSMIAFFKSDLIKDTWGFYLFSLLIILLVTTLCEQLLRYNNIIKTTRYSKTLSYGAIILFSFWILFDTKNIIKKSQACINPDYINQSMNILLDSLNIFTNISNIQD